MDSAVSLLITVVISCCDLSGIVGKHVDQHLTCNYKSLGWCERGQGGLEQDDVAVARWCVGNCRDRCSSVL